MANLFPVTKKQAKLLWIKTVGSIGYSFLHKKRADAS